MAVQATSRSDEIRATFIWASFVRGSLICLFVFPFAALSQAQTGKAPTLTVAPVPLTTTPRAAQTMIDVNFRVPPGYHINSNTPKSEFLIPTSLKMDLGSATDIILGKIGYPAGEDLSFPFSPDEKLNVYTGDFTISATTCSATLAAKAKCTISVVFKPTAKGARTGTLTVADSASGSPQTASLTGTGK